MTHGLLERPTLCSPDIDLLGEPDGRIRVEVNGVDYDEESFFVRHAYFLGANDPYQALKTTLEAEIDREAWESLHSDVSRPFAKPSSGRIAVKVIDHLGDEVMKVFRVGEGEWGGVTVEVGLDEFEESSPSRTSRSRVRDRSFIASGSSSAVRWWSWAHSANGRAALVDAVRNGALDSQTLIFDSVSDRWMTAGSHPLFVAVERLAVETKDPPPGLESSRAHPGGPGADDARQAPDTATVPTEVGGDDAHMIACPECGARNKTMAALCFNCRTFLDRVPEVPNPGYSPQAEPDVSVEEREHGFRGKAYIGLSYLCAVVWAVVALVLMGLGLEEGDGALALVGIAMVALSVGSYALARGVARFKEGARHIALVLLYLGALGSAASILTPAEPGESGAAFFSLLLQVAFIHYFHTRRSLFGDRGSPPKRRIAIF